MALGPYKPAKAVMGAGLCFLLLLPLCILLVSVSAPQPLSPGQRILHSVRLDCIFCLLGGLALVISGLLAHFMVREKDRDKWLMGVGAALTGAGILGLWLFAVLGMIR